MTIMFHQAIAHRIGLNGTDHKCADLLFQMGPMTAGELAEWTGVTTGAITGVLDRLEQAGFVRRVKDPHDRRRVIIELNPSPELMDRMNTLFRSFIGAVEETASHYTDAQLEVIIDFMNRTAAATREETKKLRKHS
jgi:DNA-binding transcriptional regulator GbsR (MarR family)